MASAQQLEEIPGSPDLAIYLIRNQEPQDHLEAGASLSDESRCFEFRSIIVIRSHKPHGDDLSRKQLSDHGRLVLSDGHFALPLAVGASVASDVIIDRAAAAHDAVLQHRYADRVALDALHNLLD